MNEQVHIWRYSLGLSLTPGSKGPNISQTACFVSCLVHISFLVLLPNLAHSGDLSWAECWWTNCDFFSLPQQARVWALNKLIQLFSEIIKMNDFPYGSPMNWSRKGNFLKNLKCSISWLKTLTRLGAELSWIPEDNKKDFIQWKNIIPIFSNYVLAAVFCNSYCSLSPHCLYLSCKPILLIEGI